MKVLLSIFFFVFLFSTVKGQKSVDSLFNVLKSEISKKKFYDNEKESRLNKLKHTLAQTPKDDYKTQYALFDQLHEEYKNYKFDSAHVYCVRLLKAAKQLNDLPKQYESEIKLGLIQLSWGMYKETFDGIAKLNVNKLPDSIKQNYYALKYRALKNLAGYNTDEFYSPANKSESLKALDSSVRLSKPGSYEYYKYYAQLLTSQKKDSDAARVLYKVVNDSTNTYHNRAMAAHDLSHLVNDSEKKRLTILSAIYDLRSATNQTLAAFTLGRILFKEGNLEDAELMLNLALKQARYYGSTIHENETLTVLDQVKAKELLNSAVEKNRVLVVMIALVTVALTCIGFVSIIVYNSLKKVRIREAIVQDKYQHLDNINKRLSEDAHIKEEYIGYFFNVISGYILQLEKIKRQTERKLKTNSYEELLQLAKEIDIKQERENLFYTFDSIFLKLFPNFITAFNSLLKPEDRIWPKDNEILNTNLRVFALMRLGIKDSQTIANILETSISTIYTYKNRIKAKALVHGNDFYDVIMDIKFVDLERDVS